MTTPHPQPETPPQTPSDAADQPASRDWIANVRRVVIKLGSRVLVDEQNRLDEANLRSLVAQMASLRSRGLEVICVSSGAIAAGMGEMGLTARPRDLPSLQAAAAVGQARLAEIYRQAFAEHGLSIGQMLLTHADLRSRERHLNAANTLHRLLSAGLTPIVNENDTVAVDEIRIGDNDTLSALVTNLAQADVLIMLTTADGLLSRPPGRTDNGGRLVPLVRRITPDVYEMASGAGSDVGTGGMRTKISAAEICTRAGERAVIANGRTKNILPRLLDGEPLGTVFEPSPQRMSRRKRWIAFFNHPRGVILIDAGAAKALTQDGRSLLAIGVKAIEGDFSRGAVVRIQGPSGGEIARGLANYTAEELRRIAGCRSDRIAEVLGQCEYEEVVHRDNLVLA